MITPATNRYQTPTFKRLKKIQNELAAYAPIDIITITGFMKTHTELRTHLAASIDKLRRYK